MSIAPRALDLTAAREQVLRGGTTAGALMAESLAAANTPACAHAYVRRFDAAARATAAAIDQLNAAGQPLPALAGLAVSVKDLFDVAGAPTTAGSAAMADVAPAVHDCPAVARLRAAGAALTGHTNLSEFAFSGVGLNPHHGTPANVATTALDAEPRVPGGSTSGGAVSVATGAAWAALGSDTGGSIRIPAALHGLVGFKGTQRLVPLDGVIPLSTSLDTACAITRSVRDAALLHQVLAARHVAPAVRQAHDWRFAVPTTLMLDGLEPAVASTFESALRALRSAGAQIVERPVPAFAELAALNAGGGFAAAESWAWHRGRLSLRGESYDPRVAHRIRRGEAMGAADYIDLLNARRNWIARVEAAFAGIDVMLVPTVPVLPPPIAPLLADDNAFFALNGQLLRNPSAINFLDGCAISLPCHADGDWPVGLMLFAPAMADDQLLAAAAFAESVLAHR